jgi:hypothetical protein
MIKSVSAAEFRHVEAARSLKTKQLLRITRKKSACTLAFDSGNFHQGDNSSWLSILIVLSGTPATRPKLHTLQNPLQSAINPPAQRESL